MNRIFLFIIISFSFIYADIDYNFINLSPSLRVNLFKKYCIQIDKKYEHTVFYIQNYPKDFSAIRNVLKKLPAHSNISIFVGNKLVVDACKPGFTVEEKKYIDKHSSFGDKLLKDIKSEADDDYAVFLAKIKGILKKEKFTNKLPNFKILDNYSQSDVFIFYNKFIKPSDDMNYAYVYVNNYRLYKRNKESFAKYKGYVKGEYFQFPKFENVAFYTIPIFIQINSRKLRGQILLKIGNNKNIINGWIEVYGVLLAPLKGKVKIINGLIYKINAKVANNFYYYGNWAKKQDRVILSLKHGNYVGKYFNYSYVFKNNPTHYFEYTLVGKRK